ncbi:DUF2889 domain-containing protein [Oceanobacter sp. 3_MG-2023]|uniref:DUF2889 domain-containing protein n=2 Tax=Oceanobacter TaxID=196079 RepID=UPI0027344B50|nr:DUF2889 domain-containing protein [Oceanobacter sp. 3_MG-2023]MDP2507136.1 DUF2889 domain-containing protein [Oceanobacter sp. 3_MG-2023]
MSIRMPEDIRPVTRTPLHRRQIDVQGYLRSDGLWEVEATMMDTKHYAFHLRDKGELPVGSPLHDMTMTLAVDDRLVIREVRADMRSTPYRDCSGAGPRYDLLVGIKIRSGWINDVKEALGRSYACTHLTELLPVLATAAFQTIQGYRLQHEPGYASSPVNRKHMTNTCYGYREGGRADTILWQTETE